MTGNEFESNVPSLHFINESITYQATVFAGVGVSR